MPNHLACRSHCRGTRFLSWARGGEPEATRETGGACLVKGDRGLVLRRVAFAGGFTLLGMQRSPKVLSFERYRLQGFSRHVAADRIAPGDLWLVRRLDVLRLGGQALAGFEQIGGLALECTSPRGAPMFDGHGEILESSRLLFLLLFFSFFFLLLLLLDSSHCCIDSDPLSRRVCIFGRSDFHSPVSYNGVLE